MEFQEDALERAKRVKLIIFDVDGVLTDGGIYIGADAVSYTHLDVYKRQRSCRAS